MTRKLKIVLIILSSVAVCYILLGYKFQMREFTTEDFVFSINSPNQKTHCLLISCTKGNLGNQIWEYMSLYVTWHHFKHSNYVACIETWTSRNLEDLFKNLSISISSSNVNITEICNDGKSKSYIYKNRKLEEYTRWFDRNVPCQNLFLEQYSTRYNDIITFGTVKIKEEMRFNEDLVQEIQIKLKELAAGFGMLYEDVTFIGMHYRGKDYVSHLESNYNKNIQELPNHYYYRRAMRYFKGKYKEVVFVLITADLLWLSENQNFIAQEGNVIVNPYTDDRIRDLALLSHCDHSIISYGTFGATGAFFAGGTTIAYDLKLPLDHRGATLALGLASVLENWRLLI